MMMEESVQHVVMTAIQEVSISRVSWMYCVCVCVLLAAVCVFNVFNHVSAAHEQRDARVCRKRLVCGSGPAGTVNLELGY